MAHASSMTGFARIDVEANGRRWSWEVKSVNGRGFEARFRLPSGFDELEIPLREAARNKIKRGSLNVFLSVKTEDQPVAYKVNEQALSAILDVSSSLVKNGVSAPPTADGILSLRGVLETVEQEQSDDNKKALHAALKKSFDDAIDALAASRQAEGKNMADVLTGQLDQIDALLKDAIAAADDAIAKLRERLNTQITELLNSHDISEERLAQEAAILAVKADVREETDRLGAHIAAARELLQNGGAMGRQLDFLTQELNREVNTICSKAPDITLKQIGLDMKQIVDQFREQIQNVE
ncbi:MAG: YicC family protein [Marinicaulis sp.]|nr:YicC family protein [Marinicaulis sp.]